MDERTKTTDLQNGYFIRRGTQSNSLPQKPKNVSMKIDSFLSVNSDY